MHLSLSYPHPHSPGKRAHRLFSLRQTMAVFLGLARGGKCLSDSRAPEENKHGTLFIDLKPDSLSTSCSLAFRLRVTSNCSCLGLGISAPPIFPVLYISDTLCRKAKDSSWNYDGQSLHKSHHYVKITLLSSPGSTPLVLSLMLELEEAAQARSPGAPDLLISGSI